MRGLEPPTRELYRLYAVLIPKLLEFVTESGAGNRNRTRDLLLTRQLLYQLSYSGN